MSMVYCAECGTKISEHAEACPYCGFRGNDDKGLSTSNQAAIQPPSWRDASLNKEFSSVLPFSQRQIARFDRLFTNAEALFEVAPALFNVLETMLPDTLVAAKIPNEVQKLLDKGVLKFVTDKNGEILPTIFKDGKMFKQVRLEELAITPKFGNAIVDLQQQAALAEILHEVREVHEAVREVSSSLQNDRLALVDAALQELQLATLIKDARVREVMLLGIAARAAESKHKLMYSFTAGMEFFKERSDDKGAIKILLDAVAQNEAATRSCDQFKTLAALTRAVQVEATAYCLVDEREAARASLMQFASFNEANNLDDRETLVKLSQFNHSDQKHLIGDFMKLQTDILALPSPSEWSASISEGEEANSQMEEFDDKNL